MSNENVLYEDTIPGGSHWSFSLKRGQSLKLIDVNGGANVGMLFYNPYNPLERYNAPDTLKCQHTFKLTQGHCLYSDMGRVFCSIVDDTVGWHDSAMGTCNKKMVIDKWGEKTYQQAGNDFIRSGRDSFLIELAKYGLGKKDMAANLNLFSKVTTDEEGNISLRANNSKPGDSVTLHFEMDTLIVFHTCPHPLDMSTDYPRNPVTYQFIESDELVSEACRKSRPENERGFMNNYLYHLSH